LAGLPLSPSGKVDRRALARRALDSSVAASESGSAAPQTPLEHYLVGLWQEVLRIERTEPIGIDDDFFALGGNSISAAILVNRLQEKLGEIVHVVTIFDAPTISALAAYLVAQYPRAVARLWGEGGESLADAVPAAGAVARVDTDRVAAFRQWVRPLSA